MTYFQTGTLAESDSFETPLDGLWTIALITGGWSNPEDETAAASVYFSADEGATWYLVSSPNSGWPGYLVLSNLPTNAVKVTVTTAAEGNTLSFSLTGK
jgi:hypothetical protein